MTLIYSKPISDDNKNQRIQKKRILHSFGCVKGYVAPTIGPMTFDRCHHILYYATLHPTLQPTETAPAYKFNLRRNIGVGCKIGQEIRHPDRVRPPRV